MNNAIVRGQILEKKKISGSAVVSSDSPESKLLKWNRLLAPHNGPVMK